MSSNKRQLVGARSVAGPARTYNEDAFSVPPESALDTQQGALFVVADGVGGQEAGEVAANMATAIIQRRYYALRAQDETVANALHLAITYANQRIYETAQQMGRRIGCTLAAAVLQGGQLYVAHVGDARVYRADPRAIQRMTRDHSWVQEQVDRHVLTQSQARRHDFRNLVQRVLGNNAVVDVDISGPHPLQSADVLLLCSDGLSDVIPDETIHKELVSPKSAQKIAEQLIALAEESAHDNITALVVQVTPPSLKAVPPPPLLAAPVQKSRDGKMTTLIKGLEQRQNRRVFILVLILLVILSLSAIYMLVSGRMMQDVFFAQEEPAPTVVQILNEAVAETTPAEEESTSAVVNPTSTIVLATATPQPQAASGFCMADGPVFAFSDSQLGGCGLFTNIQFNRGEEVMYLVPDAIVVDSPSTCGQRVQLVKVQSVASPSKEGWLTASTVGICEE